LRKTVIGIGNLLRADDGIGVHVVNRLREERPEIEAVDLSTANIEILDFIRNRDEVIIVDAMRSGAEPGTIRKMSPGELKRVDFAYSHGLDLYGVIMLGMELYPDEMPRKLVVLAVEAGDIDSFTSELTPRVREAVPRILEAIEEEFREFGG
jgi:hydrogenase maturation protease